MFKDYPKKTLLVQIALFILTILTTTIAGTEWIYGKSFFLSEKGFGWGEWISSQKLIQGLQFSIPFLIILSIHEFGHFLTAWKYGIKCTLPYYIPFWTGIMLSLGTIGAFIRITGAVKSRKEFFDVGIAGPLAGFIAALLVLYYGFTHLPPIEYIFTIHPEYQKYGTDFPKFVYKGIEGFYLGNNLIFWFFQHYVADPKLLPNKFELMHYPIILAGYFSLFFTALNLLPIGQLDGGHILYGLIGKKYHDIISPIIFIAFVFYAGLGTINPYTDLENILLNTGLYTVFLFFIFRRVFEETQNAWLVAVSIVATQFVINYFYPNALGYNGWLLFAFIIGRFLGVKHPETEDDAPLDLKRKILGWITLIIFVLCFSPQPLTFE